MTHLLQDRLAFIAQLAPCNQLALIDDSRQLTYAELIDAIELLDQWFNQQNCQVVALQADNAIDWVICDLACQLGERTFLPLPDFFSAEQTLNSLRDAGAELFLTDCTTQIQKLFSTEDTPTKKIPLQATPQITPQVLTQYSAWKLHVPLHDVKKYPPGTEKITFTSGSTGHPKGVCLNSKHQWQVAESLATVVDLSQPRHLCLLPLATLLENIAGVYTPLLSAGTVVLSAGKTRGLSGSSGLDMAVLLNHINEQQPNSLILLPQLLIALVAACEQGWIPPKSFKFIAVGGAKVAPELIHSAREYGLPVYEGYGLSECGSVVALNTPKSDQAGSAGGILPHCQAHIENNEIVITNSCHLGYLGDPDSWNQNSVYTGDLGQLKNRRISINGRKKNLLISSFGRNISPEWIESQLLAKPLLSQCVVIGDHQPHLSALLSAPDRIRNTIIQDWIQQVNLSLPDYAQIKVWRRIAAHHWHDLLTANGRPKRDLIEPIFTDLIREIYSSPSDANSEHTKPHANAYSQKTRNIT